MLTTICIQIAPEISTNTKCAAKDRNMPGNPTARCVLLSHRGVIAGQHYDDRRIDGYQSS